MTNSPDEVLAEPEAKRRIYRHLRDYADHFVPVDGLSHVEISHGQVIVMMSPAGFHELAALRVRRQFDAQLPPGLTAHTGGDIEDPELGILRRPDLLVLPEEAMAVPGAIDPREVVVAVEIVSRSNPENDYESKLRDYPAMGIPHYLIVDPRNGTCVHYWQVEGRPDGAAYANRVSSEFGEKVTIGEWVIDTAELPRYTGQETR